jgi:hypothetical protein
MNLFKLLDTAEHKLDSPDPIYNEQTDLVLSILRATGVLPFKRASLNGRLHKIVSAAVVSAYEAGETIDVSTRRAGTLHEYGYSTKIVEYLDKAVKQKLLLSQTNRAEGKLSLGPVLTTYLDHSLV